MLHNSRGLWGLFCLVLALLSAAIKPSFAEDSPAKNVTRLKTTVVTGTYLPARQGDIASPVEIIDRIKIESSGAVTLNDLVKDIESNVGAEFNADVFTQNTSGGTSQINLRGLGLSSTLTLLNGRRTTLSGAFANDGSTFVDINTIPLIAIDQIAILKDGASALYGSDAVSGVVNFITRKNFEGLELDFGKQITTDGGQSDIDANFLWGQRSDQFSSLLAFSYFDRSPLTATNRSYTDGTGISVLGSPGAFIPLGSIDPASPYFPFNGLAPGVPIRDLGCLAGGGGIADGANPVFGTCDLDFMPFFNLVPEENRIQSMLTMDWELNDRWSLFAEFGYAKTKQVVTSAPSLPNLTFPVVPANNIGNLAVNGGFGTPVVMIGRALSSPYPGAINKRYNDTWRMVFGASHQIDNTWHLDTVFQYSGNYTYLDGPETLTDRFNAALAGAGGPNNNEFFNPFSSALTNPALANSQSVIDDFTAISFREIRTRLQTWEATFTGALFELTDGPIESAFGAQYRYETNDHVLDENSLALNYVFSLGGQNSSANKEVYSLFSEFMVPLTSSVNMQIAGRFEEHGSKTGSSFDPKLGILWYVSPSLSFRSSVSSAFHAPNLHQLSSSTIAASEIEGSFVPIATDGNPDLKPEEAVIISTGVVYNPSDYFSTSLDYWHYDYENIVVKESAEGIHAANPNDPRIIRDPNSGRITRINLSFINTSSVITDGIDLNFTYKTAFKYGILNLNSNSSYINRYDLVQRTGEAKIDAAGNRNFLNIARPLPPWRSSLTLDWLYKQHQITTITKYTDNYDDDENSNARIDSHLTQNVQYSYLFLSKKQTEVRLAVGALNIFDQEPPSVSTTLGFDSNIHDPRGRLVYSRITMRY